jgi:hypothetical protein
VAYSVWHRRSSRWGSRISRYLRVLGGRACRCQPTSLRLRHPAASLASRWASAATRTQGTGLLETSRASISSLRTPHWPHSAPSLGTSSGRATRHPHHRAAGPHVASGPSLAWSSQHGRERDRGPRLPLAAGLPRTRASWPPGEAFSPAFSCLPGLLSLVVTRPGQAVAHGSCGKAAHSRCECRSEPGARSLLSSVTCANTQLVPTSTATNLGIQPRFQPNSTPEPDARP